MLTFNHTEGADKLPAVQTVSVTGGSSSSPMQLLVTVSGGPWLAVTPVSGAAPMSIKVSVNPATLPVGTYTGTIQISQAGGPATVPVGVTLSVKAPPPVLSAAPNPVSVTWVKGTSLPGPVKVSLSTGGALLSYTVTTAGGAWLSASPKSGIVFPAFSNDIDVLVNPASLAPGSYKGTVTIAASQAANKTQTVNVNLTVSAGPASISSLWPDEIPAGSPPVTVTITGSNFYSGSVVKAGTATLASSLVGPDVMTAILPAALLASAGTVAITVSNPGTGGGDSSPATFTVTAPGPKINALVNAASFLGGKVAPGEMVVLFGRSLGPPTLASFVTPPPGSPIAATLQNARVLFDTTPAPVIYASAQQTAVMVPYDVAGKSTVAVRAEYEGVLSSPLTVPVAASSPGIYTASGTGAGGAAAFNYDESGGGYTLNTESTPAVKGGVLVLYATGEGVTVPASADGAIVTAPATTPNPAVSLQVGTQDATILYTGGVVGLVSGLMQINARLPAEMTAGKAVPLTLTINGQVSQPGVTIAVK